MNAAYDYGMGPENLAKPNGRQWFLALADRLHLAVVAKCARFCTFAEAFICNLTISDRSKYYATDQMWPQNSSELVERYNRHLGLDLPQHVQPLHERKTAVVEETPEPVAEGKSHSRDQGDDWGTEPSRLSAVGVISGLSVDNPFPFLPDHPHTRVALSRPVPSIVNEVKNETSLTGKNRASPRRSALAPWWAASPDAARPGSHL